VKHGFPPLIDMKNVQKNRCALYFRGPILCMDAGVFLQGFKMDVQPIFVKRKSPDRGTILETISGESLK